MITNLKQRPMQFLAAILISIICSGCASDKLLRQRWSNCPPVTDKKFDEALTELAGITLLKGNRITELVNGEEFFPAMVEAIRGAQQSVDFENFVWRSGEVSTRLIEALSERARAGVKIHFLVDALGATKLVPPDLEKLQKAGVIVAKYNPPWFPSWFSVNHRTHRKTLVVDGKTGFIGGISIADEWLNHTENPGRWRDSNYRVEGPIIGQLQKIFALNWTQATGEKLQGDEEVSAGAGSCEAACFMSGPGEGDKSARRIFFLSIAAAQKSLRLAHSYFIPDNSATKLLIDARQRGVKVEIITPGLVNLNFVRRASRSRWQKLLDAGVEFYEYQPTKYHLKLIVVDDIWVTAGSINFDERSFRINDEANFVARDRDFAATQISTFEADKRLSQRVDEEKFKRRPWRTKVAEYFFGLLRFQL
ncbi:MAG: phospholipase D-like domain-containing protein [Verrucomicrobiota bacterium]